MSILGLDIVTLSLIIAVTGTVIHQLKTNYGKPLPKIINGIMLTVGASFVAAHTVLSQIIIIDPFQQMLLVLSLTGVAVPGTAVLAQKITPKIKSKIKPKKLKLTPPELFPKNAILQTNLVRDESKGAVMPKEQCYLWIKVRDAKSYVSVILKDKHGNAIQVDQSHELDEDNNVETTRLELFAKDGKRLDAGKYSLIISADSGSSYYIGFKDNEFEIL